MAQTQRSTEYVQHEGDHLVWAKVWIVEPARGDLFVVSVAGGTNQFLLVADGIVNLAVDNPYNQPMEVMCDATGRVVALPANYADRLVPCWEMPTPPLDVFENLPTKGMWRR
jgi:hypothetical protein